MSLHVSGMLCVCVGGDSTDTAEGGKASSIHITEESESVSGAASLPVWRSR